MRRRECIPLMVIDLIREKNETADEAEIAAVFEEKYPEFSRNVYHIGIGGVQLYIEFTVFGFRRESLFPKYSYRFSNPQ